MTEVEVMTTSSMKKYKKKVTRCLQILRKDSGIMTNGEVSNYKVLYIGNIGHTTGYDEAGLLEQINLCNAGNGVQNVQLFPGKQYSFVSYTDAALSHAALNNIVSVSTKNNTGVGNASNDKEATVIYAALIDKAPDSPQKPLYAWPQGLRLVQDFITEEEEAELLASITWDDDLHTPDMGGSLKHRRVRHYGYAFQYGSNSIDRLAPLEQAPIPPLLRRVARRLLQTGAVQQEPDQITVNRYQPGQGIPSHTDSHSACGLDLVSLSTGAPVVMEFTDTIGVVQPSGSDAITTVGAPVQCDVLLPTRSIAIMTGECRYRWRHCIKARFTDMVREGGGLKLVKRGVRTSFTFRSTRQGPCTCNYPQQCDSRKDQLSTTRGSVPAAHVDCTNTSPGDVEARYVFAVYDNIADHFSETRHKPWPNVEKFVCALPHGSLLLDVGCGNGKYLGLNKLIMQVGCDSSGALLGICRDRGHQAVQCNCLKLPYKNNLFDGVVCIAVLHHLASQERRVSAIAELLRVLAVGGEALVYVWALEQRKHGRNSAYLRQNKKKKQPSNEREAMGENCDSVIQPHDDIGNIKSISSHNVIGITNSKTHGKFMDLDELEQSITGVDDSNQPSIDLSKTSTIEKTVNPYNKEEGNVRTLPIHENRTDFLQQDMLVPWKVKRQKHDNNLAVADAPIYHRFYHTFKEGELESICSMVPGLQVVKSYYDEGNWCILFKKCLNIT